MAPASSSEARSLPPIAIVGMSFRFPDDAVTAKDFWKMLIEKRCASTETPPDRFNVDSHHHPDNGRTESLSIRGGHFMTGDLGAFDAPFFSIGSAEAEAMDPAQRLTLETTYRALENAGIPIERAAGSKTCVFSGSFSRDYATMLDHDPDIQPKYRATGTATNMLANRVSWFFDLTGPSVNVDTACSSSLVALDLACQSIWSGDSEMGLACGSNCMLTPEFGMALDNLSMLGKDSRCYSFDHRANGYARGEGFGVLVIKPVDAALRDGDTIRAVIRSSCSNQDGKTPTVTMPGRDAQERLIKDAYAKAGLDLGVTRYFEAHGTGTPVGDPIEAGAIGAAFRTYRSSKDPLYIGSVKSNIGHLEGASGVAGVVKAILALEAGVIPPNSNFEELNPKIDADFLNIRVPSDAVPWPTTGLRRASIQSFGFGGANSHIIIDDAFNFLQLNGLQGNHNTAALPPKPPTNGLIEQPTADSDGGVRGIDVINRLNAAGTPGNVSNEGSKVLTVSSTSSSASSTSAGDGRDSGYEGTNTPDSSQILPRVLVWSAFDESGVTRSIANWKDYFSKIQLAPHKQDYFVRDLAYTLTARRSHFAWRTFSVTKDAESLASVGDQMVPTIKARVSPKLAFVFTGQGSQWYAMGRELLFRYPVYRNNLINAGIYLQGLGCSWDPLEELLRNPETTNINDSLYSQTLCTALQVALVDLMESFGVRPTAVVGHSSGEIAAAYCTGALSRQAAWKIAYFRGVVSARLAATSMTQGAMMAVGLSATDTQIYLRKVAAEFEQDQLVVACVNSPKNVTVSGDSSHVGRLEELLKEADIFARRLKVPVGYHSFQMREVADDYLQYIGKLSMPEAMSVAPQMVSSVTGSWIAKEDLVKPEYWVRNLVSPVLFYDAMATLCSKSQVTSSKKLDGSHLKTIAITDLVEIGPHAALQGPSREILRSISQDKAIGYTSALVRNTPAVHSLLELAGRMHCLGHHIDLLKVNMDGTTRTEPSASKVLSNLPEYPFNHTKSYWTESRISKDYRFRKNPRHDLVGAQAADWNPLEARWRNTIKPADLPWVDDHKINETVLYPAAGMLVMAIEGTRQLADPTKDLDGFLFKDCAFHSALNIPPQGIEVNMCIRPRKDQNEKDSGWHDFRLYMYRDGGWHENCNGSIQLVYTSPESVIDQGREQKQWNDVCIAQYDSGERDCHEIVDRELLYKRLAESGYQYGPTFQAVSSLAHNAADKTVAEVEMYRYSRYHDGPDPDKSHVIHPTTLDCILQGVLAVHTKGGTEKIPTAIPTGVDKLWISLKGLSAPDTDSVRVYTTGHRIGMRETVSHLVVLDATKTKVLIEAQSFRSTDVTSDEAGDNEDAEQNTTPDLCHTIDWKPDTTLLSPKDVQTFCDNSVAKAAEPVEFFTEVNFMLTAYIKRNLEAINIKLTSGLELNKHMQMYYDWMRHRVDLLEQPDSPFNTPEWKVRMEDNKFLDSLTAKIEATNKQGLFYATIARNHLQLLTGEMDALELLFEGDLVKDHYYEIEENTPCMHRLRHFLDAMVHKNPGAKFLELGAGTGAMTHQLMKTLTHHGDGESCRPRYERFDYTDLSPFFFGAAQEKYSDQGSKMKFKVLNIETDPETQGFECGTYDAVFAAAVLHATIDLTATLKHCRKLLRPGGKIILFEPTTFEDGLRTNFAFGLLEGWWLSSESYRKWSPCVDPPKWDELFKQTGFSGTDAVLNDYYETPCQEFSVLISTAVQTMAPATADKTNIALIHGTGQEQLARRLQSRYLASPEGEDDIVAVISMDAAMDAELPDPGVLVFLLELEDPLWYDIDEALYANLQSLLTASLTTKVCWVSRDGRRNGKSDAPAYRLIDGLSRVLNSEVDDTVLTCLTLQDFGDVEGLTDQQLDHIVQVSKLFRGTEGVDTEYIEREGLLTIPRLIETVGLNEELYKRVVSHQDVNREWADGVPLRLVIGSPGLLNTLHFIEDKERDLPIAPGEVEIEVRSTGVNFRDLLIALGRLQQRTIGCECAGVVTKIGAGCEGLQVGDRVATCPFDSYKSYVRLDYRAVAKIPDTISFPVAAAIPVNYTTAWLAFTDLARVKAGETVLIHSAAGGTGQAAIQVAHYLGATVLATVSSEAKKKLLTEHYGVKADHIFSSRDPALFSKGVRRVTGGCGVDVIFNSLSGEGLVASWECIAPYGRFVEIGKKDILGRNALPMAYFEKNVSFHALDISLFSRDRPQVGRKAMEDVFALIAQGKLEAAQPLAVYPVSELEKAFRIMQGGKMFGKIVIEMQPDDRIQASLETKPTCFFRPNATYVISGGLGGIGRAIASWMVDRGAQNLILLSRSGSHNAHAAPLKEELGDKGARVETPRCDISDISAVKAALDHCAQTMPPVAGCIQASMVLSDAAFTSMTHKAWKEATAPKVQGSWNLHASLPQGMDFFVTLSSITGVVGSRGQANYAAGNAFQDALVRHRVEHGERAAALDLGPFFAVGVMTENKDLRDRWGEMVDLPVTVADLFALLDYYCNPLSDAKAASANQVQAMSRDLLRCQAIVGLARWQSAKTALYFKKPMMRNLVMEDGGLAAIGRGSDAEGRVNFAAVFGAAESLIDAAGAVGDALTQKLSSVLSLSYEELDRSLPMHTYGVDSLVAVELRNWFTKNLQANIAIFDILGGNTITTISALVAAKSKFRKTEWDQ